MDRESPAAGAARRPRDLKWPRGVTRRAFATEERIQIAFVFRGDECRELMPPGPITQTAINLAAGKRAEVQRHIAADTFDYGAHFPHSPRAARYGKPGAAAARADMATLLQRQRETYERQEANGTLKPSTVEGYVKAINSARMKWWHGKTLQDAAQPSMLREWIKSLDVTAKRARNLLTPLRSVFEDALTDELIPFNPFDRIALDKLLRQVTKASDYEVDPFTAGERAEIIRHARADEAPLIRFWLATGLRPGELMALRWHKIDWERRVARVDINLVSRKEVSPKTAAGVRDVELDDEAVAALIAAKPATFAAGAHVFHNPRNGKPWATDSQIRKTLWQPLLERAQVRYRNPYQCRHTFASAQLTAGANPWWMAEQLGHVDVEMVFKTYGKFIAVDYQKPKAPRLRVVGSE